MARYPKCYLAGPDVGTGPEAFLTQVRTRLDQASALLRRSAAWMSHDVATRLSDVIRNLNEVSGFPPNPLTISATIGAGSSIDRL